LQIASVKLEELGENPVGNVWKYIEMLIAGTFLSGVVIVISMVAFLLFTTR